MLVYSAECDCQGCFLKQRLKEMQRIRTTEVNREVNKASKEAELESCANCMAMQIQAYTYAPLSYLARKCSTV